MNVNAVEQRSTDVLLVAEDLRRGAGVFLYRIAVIAARTGVHRGEEHKVRGEGKRARCPYY